MAYETLYEQAMPVMSRRDGCLPHSAAVNLTFQGWKTNAPASLISHFLYPTVAQMTGLVSLLGSPAGVPQCICVFQRTLGS